MRANYALLTAMTLPDCLPANVSTDVDTSTGETFLDAVSARHLTTAIQVASEALFVLLERAHSGRAWASLGYDSWKTYVDQELGLSRSRSYQLLDQATVNTAIEGAAGVSLAEPITEAQARRIKPDLDGFVDEVRNRTVGLSDPARVHQVVTAMLNAVRHSDADPLNIMPSMAALRGPVQGSGSGSDLWYTPRNAVIPLLPSLPPPPGRVWCPADVDGQSYIVEVLRETGYDVVCTDLSTGQDFLAYTRETMPRDIDFVATNPPYSLKRRWVEHLSHLGIERWSLLLPELGLGDWSSASLSPLGGQVGMVMLSRRIAYSATFGVRSASNPPFSSLWLTCGLARPGEQIVFREVPRTA